MTDFDTTRRTASTTTRRFDGRDRPTQADDWEFDPMVPMTPRSTYATDGGTTRPRTRPRDFDRQPTTDHSPTDRDSEEIEPLVPDLR